MIVFPVIFRVNPAIPQETGDAYKKYIQDIINNSVSLSKEVHFHFQNLNSVSLSDPVTRLDNYLKELSDQVSEQGKRNAILFLSIEKTLPPNTLFDLSYYISEVLQKKNKLFPNFEGKIFLQMPALINEDDEQYRTFLKEFAQNGQFLNFDFNGNSLVELPKKNLRKIKKTSKEYQDKTIDLIESLKLKMIRRVGHFKRELIKPDGSIEQKYCHRFFFDGSKCKDEIRDIVKCIIEKEKALNNAVNIPIIYHAPMSKWLEDSIQGLDTHLLNASSGLNAIFSEEAFGNNDRFILLFDLIDSGNTFENEIFWPLKNEKPQIEFNVYSVIRIAEVEKYGAEIEITNNLKSYTDELVFKNSENKITIHSFYKGQQQRERSPCPMCDLNIPFSNPSSELFLRLSSFDFWYLCNNYKFKPESDVPGMGFNNIMDVRKEGFKYMPNFRELFLENGAYLAKKMEDFLLTEEIIRKDDRFPTTFICPDQRGALEFAKNLKSIIKNCEVILIPDKVYKKIGDKKDSKKIFEELKEDEHPWLGQIMNLQGGNRPHDVIIFDEYTTSGHTLYQLHLLITHYGLTTACFFPIFILKRESKYFNLLSEPLYSLYDLDVKFTPIF